MSELVGKTLADRYRIDKFIGRGGMAEVYKVYDTHRNAELAMKVLHEDLALDRVFLRRFKREAQTLAQLQHPNIVRLYGLEQDGRTVFMLMDYIDGESLKHKIFDADGPMPYEQVMGITEPLCKALQFAHNEGFVHADVKPANIMISKSGRVMLSDFGIARMTEGATVTMVGAGTPSYMAPEQARGKNPTPLTDIYALGIVLYEMLTGDRPFRGESTETEGSTSEKMRWEQINLEPQSPRSINPDISPELEALILKNLSKEPELRYESSIDLYNALKREAPQDNQAEKQPETIQDKVAAETPSKSPDAGEEKEAVEDDPAEEVPKRKPKRKSKRLGTIGIIIGIFLIVGSLLVLLSNWNLSDSFPVQFSNSASTPTPKIITQKSAPPTRTPQGDDCYHWREITANMQGKDVCVKGLIQSLNRSNKIWTRYEFSDKPNTFFVFSTSYEYYDSKTGKTIAPGMCIFLEGEILIFEGIPHMDMDTAHKNQALRFSPDSNDCK